MGARMFQLDCTIPAWLKRSEVPTPCAVCGAEIAHPGVCSDCGRAEAEREMAKVMRFARETVPERHRWATLDSPELLSRCSQAGIKAVVGLLGRKLPVGLALHGPAGSGKTSVAVAMLQRIHASATVDAPELVVRRARGAWFVSMPDLRSVLNEARRGEAAPELLQRCRAATVLVLDDLGGQVREEVSDLLSYRHARELPTIVTTPYSREEAAARGLDERLARRVYEMSIGFGGAS